MKSTIAKNNAKRVPKTPRSRLCKKIFKLTNLKREGLKAEKIKILRQIKKYQKSKLRIKNFIFSCSLSTNGPKTCSITVRKAVERSKLSAFYQIKIFNLKLKKLRCSHVTNICIQETENEQKTIEHLMNFFNEL